MAQNNKLLRIEELVLYFKTTHGPVQAVDGVNFELDYNRAVVILGESGCGKVRSPRPFCDFYPVMPANIPAVFISTETTSCF